MKDYSSLSRLVANTLSSPHHQHFTSLTVGRTGSGKSLANLSWFEQTSIKMSYALGGDPEDYFTLDNNVAIITMPEVVRVIKGFKKYGLYLFDDIGIAWNSRKWQSPVNILLNNLFQTIRTQNNLIAATIPDSFLVDIVPRSLVHYFIEMEAGIFEKNISIAKVFEVVRKPRSGDTHYQYPYDHGKYQRYIFHRPSKKLEAEYNSRRSEIYDELQEQSIANLLMLDENGQEANKPRQLKKDMIPKVTLAINEGMDQIKACKKYGMTTRYYQQCMKENSC